MGIRVAVTLCCDAPGCDASCPATASLGSGFGLLTDMWTDIQAAPEHAAWKRASAFSSQMLCPVHAPEFEAVHALASGLAAVGTARVVASGPDLSTRVEVPGTGMLP